MPRSLVLGNARMLCTFDEHLQMRDFYYPYVGMEDQTSYQHFHRIGVYTEGKFHWTNDGTWDINIAYADDTLVGSCTATHHEMELELLFEDFVYTTSTILFRKVTVRNVSNRTRDIRLFFSHDLHLYGDKMQDTAQYEPELDGVLHYRKNRYFLVSGQWEDGTVMDQFTVGKADYQDKEGTWRDAEDGHLHGNPIEQGSVDSTIGFSHVFVKDEAKVLHTWLIAGKKYEDICEKRDRIFELGPKTILAHTRDFWRKWVNKEHFSFTGLPPKVIDLFKRSLLIIRTQTDHGGAIIAANDSDIMLFNKDTYTYMWPRDGALVSMALSETKYEAMVRNFLFFCEKIVTKDGYVLHKYNPDGSLGSSWHPKMKHGHLQLPIQEDESALILVAMQKYHENFHNIEVIQKLYDSVVLKIGRWMMKFIDPKTGLPLPTYDPWEEHRGVFSYTASCTHAGLMAAAFLSEETGHLNDAKKFRASAQKLQKAICTHLYSEKHQRFLKKLDLKDGTILERDHTIDASLAFVWKMGVLPPEDERVQNTMKAIADHLTIRTDVGGIARYTRDAYHFDFDGVSWDDIPGNPWIITTLWEAEYQMMRANNRDELQKPLQTLEWVVSKANCAGILPEQMHPYTGTPLSVAPLTWSHATFVSAVMLFQKRWMELGKCKVVVECE